MSGYEWHQHCPDDKHVPVQRFAREAGISPTPGFEPNWYECGANCACCRFAPETRYKTCRVYLVRDGPPGYSARRNNDIHLQARARLPRQSPAFEMRE